MSINDKGDDPLGRYLVKQAERYLTYRARKRYIAAAKAKQRGLLLDWLIALLWAVGWVFLINQYLVQAYQIPSESMEKTLNVGDRIFVNKLIFGPEVLPNFVKLASPIKVKRGDIIIFQSPEYRSAGPLFEVAHRLLYMVSFSTINLNRYAIDLLIKRAVAIDGDHVIMRNGDFYIKPRGESSFVKEATFLADSGLKPHMRRLLPESSYEKSQLIMIKRSYLSQGIELPFALKYLDDPDSQVLESHSLNQSRIVQSSFQYEQLQLHNQFYPWIRHHRSAYLRAKQGIYVPDGYILPLGDNRDNSHDGRMWGVVAKNKVLGQALLRFWPFNRFGGIK